MKNLFKKAIIHAWEFLYLKGMFPALEKKTIVFMIHRMSSPDVIEAGLPAELLEQGLRHLSHKGYRFISLEELFQRIKKGEPPLKRAIAFTMDDGFQDQARIAAPIFQQYHCPVTIFLITGFIDGGNPPWDALVKYVFFNTQCSVLKLSLGEETLCYALGSDDERYNSMKDFRNKCKSLSEEKLKQAIENLLSAADMHDIPKPVKSAKALSWDDARELEASCVTFGPHTKNHAILSNYSDARACEEIQQAWSRLNEKLERPCPVFSYPNGQKKDFSIRDITFIKNNGLQGAVMAEPGYVDFEEITEADEYLLKRMSYPSTMDDLIQYCSGLEYVKQQLNKIRLNLTYVGKTQILSYMVLAIKYRLGLFNKYKQVEWGRVSRMVFVCKGNICRSPYSEMRAKALGIDAVSIGLHTREGSAANADARRNAADRGVSLDEHKARIYQSIRLSENDLVVCMEPWHVDVFEKMDNSGCQVTLLGLWGNKEKIMLGDPYGKADMFFDDCFQAIDNALYNVKKYMSA